jgi:hypothetical protein
MNLILSRPHKPSKLACPGGDYYGLKVAEILPLLAMLGDVGGGGVAKGIGCLADHPSPIEIARRRLV